MEGFIYIVNYLTFEREADKPSLNEIIELIKSLKNNKNVRYNTIWDKEETPKEWKLRLIHLIHNEWNKLDCRNYRGNTLLNLTYKVFIKPFGTLVPTLDAHTRYNGKI